MTSSDFSSKSDMSRSSDSHDQQRTILNDLTLPPQARASPILSKHCLHCGSICTKFGCGKTCTIVDECLPTSTTALAPNYSTTDSVTTYSHPSLPDNSCKPAPIPIPPPTLTDRDINRVPTPLSGRGDRKGHLFPYSRTPSPRLCSSRSFSIKKARTFSNESDDSLRRLERIRSNSPILGSSVFSYCSTFNRTMHNEPMAINRFPASPLSPKPSATNASLAPHSPRRGNHGRQTSRNMQLNLGRYHPSNYIQADAPTALSSSITSQAPQITYGRAPAPIQIESPRLLREKHREFIDKARQSSKLAASPFAIKPDAPRLDPLGSPHGNVTPLALEEAGDYFAVGVMGKMSPVTSPGSRSPRAASISSDEDVKVGKNHKIEA